MPRLQSLPSHPPTHAVTEATRVHRHRLDLDPEVGPELHLAPPSHLADYLHHLAVQTRPHDDCPVILSDPIVVSHRLPFMLRATHRHPSPPSTMILGLFSPLNRNPFCGTFPPCRTCQRHSDNAITSKTLSIKPLWMKPGKHGNCRPQSSHPSPQPGIDWPSVNESYVADHYPAHSDPNQSGPRNHGGNGWLPSQTRLRKESLLAETVPVGQEGRGKRRRVRES